MVGNHVCDESFRWEFHFLKTEFLGYMRDVLIYEVAPFGEQKEPGFES